MMEFGRVTEAKGDFAVVRVKKNKNCDKCAACSFGSDGYMSFRAINSKNAKEGDYVISEVSKTDAALSSFLLYGVPLIALAAGILIGQTFFEQAAAFLLGFIMMFISFGVLFYIDRRLKKSSRFGPVITKIITDNEEIAKYEKDSFISAADTAEDGNKDNSEKTE